MTLRAVVTILLLVASNVFMNLAWYGHLFWGRVPWLVRAGLIGTVLLSWGLAFFEYLLQVPANRIGFKGTGGPFTLIELKTIQEVLSLTVFVVISVGVFKQERPGWNHIAGFALLVVAAWLIFRKG